MIELGIPVEAIDYHLASCPPSIPDWFEPELKAGDREMRYWCWRYYYAKQMMDIRNG